MAPEQLTFFVTSQATQNPGKSHPDAVGPGPQGVEAPCGLSDKPQTPRAKLKALREELRFAQMQVRLDLYGLKNSKAKARRIAQAMREIQSNTRNGETP